MELVVNSCILFSFFRPESFTRGLFESLYITGARLFIPDFGLDELLSLKEKICKYSGIDKDEFITSFILLCEILEVIPESVYKDFSSEATKLLPGHPKDIPFLAVALALGCAVWSDEKRFKKQSRIKIFSTQDLLKLPGVRCTLK